MIEREFFTCDCKSIEHLIVFTKWIDTGDGFGNSLELEIHLKPEHNIWERIKNAVKYLFGFRSSYGDFDSFILSPKDADRLQEVVDFLRTCKANGLKSNDIKIL